MTTHLQPRRRRPLRILLRSLQIQLLTLVLILLEQLLKAQLRRPLHHHLLTLPAAAQLQVVLLHPKQ